MKHLKRFNESIDSDIISNIKDILVDLQDKGISVEINQIDTKGGLNILISDPANLFFFNRSEDGSDTWDSLYRLNDYLDSEGYRLYDILFRAQDSKKSYHIDGTNSLDEFKRIVGVFGYHSFTYLILKYRPKL